LNVDLKSIPNETKDERRRTKGWPSRFRPSSFVFRRLCFFAGFGLLCAAQALMLRRAAILGQAGWGEWLNARFQLGLPNADNVLLALGLLICGGGLCAFGLRRDAAVQQAERDTAPTAPIMKWRDRLPLALLGLGVVLLGLLLWQVRAASSNRLVSASWLAVLMIFALTGYLMDRRAAVRLRPTFDWRDLALLAVICGLGLAVGTYRLDRFPEMLIPDEQEFWLAAKNISDGAITPPVFGFGLFSYPILGSFYQAWILQLFGPSLWSWRFGSVLAAVAAAPPTYLLARELFTRRVAVISTALMLVTPYFLAFERLGYNNSQAILPVVLALYLLYAGWQRGSLLYLTLGGIAAGLGFYTYTAARLGFVVGLAFLPALAFARKHEQTGTATRQRRIVTFVLATAFLLGWAAAALPHIVFGSLTSPVDLRSKTVQSVFANSVYAEQYYTNDQLYRDRPRIQIDDGTFFYRPDLYAELLFRGTVRSLLVFQHDAFLTDHFIVAPLAGPATVPFYSLGMVQLLLGMRQRRFLLLAIWFFGGVTLLSIVDAFPPREAHMVPLLPVMSLISALGISEVVEQVVGRLPAFRRTVAGALMLAIVGWLALSGLRSYFEEVRDFYRPNMDNMLGFLALERAAPLEMRYVYSNPDQREYAPWIVQNMQTPVNFHTIARDELAAGRVAIEPRAEYLFVFHEEEQAAVTTFLERVLQRPVTPNAYIGPGEKVTLVYQFGGQ
jgi:4-amino-4-deoxy-L-arabinose transferase-like glycosyltransferase